MTCGFSPATFETKSILKSRLQTLISSSYCVDPNGWTRGDIFLFQRVIKCLNGLDHLSCTCAVFTGLFDCCRSSRSLTDLKTSDMFDIYDATSVGLQQKSLIQKQQSENPTLRRFTVTNMAAKKNKTVPAGRRRPSCCIMCQSVWVFVDKNTKIVFDSGFLQIFWAFRKFFFFPSQAEKPFKLAQFYIKTAACILHRL